MDSKGNCWGNASLTVEGLVRAISLDVKPLTMGPSLSPETARSLLKKAGIKWDGNGRGELKRLGDHGLANASWVFTWRARTSEGEYYLQDSPMERKLYKVQSRREWRLDRKSNDDMADFVHSLPQGDRMILDSINDQVIVVTPIKINIEELLKKINTE